MRNWDIELIKHIIKKVNASQVCHPLLEEAKNTCPFNANSFNLFGYFWRLGTIKKRGIIAPRTEQQQVAVIWVNSIEFGKIGWPWIFGAKTFLLIFGCSIFSSAAKP